MNNLSDHNTTFLKPIIYVNVFLSKTILNIPINIVFPYTSKSINRYTFYRRKFKTSFSSYLISQDHFVANYAGVVNCCTHDILLSPMKTSAYTTGNELIYLCMPELLCISQTPQIQALRVTSSFNERCPLNYTRQILFFNLANVNFRMSYLLLSLFINVTLHSFFVKRCDNE